MRGAGLVIILLVVGGCNTGQKILGKWSGELSTSSIDLEFRPDMSFSSHIAKERNGGIKTDGTYKMDGNSVTLHPVTITTSVGSMDAGKASLGRDMRYSITWSGEKAMKLANMRDSMTVRKVD